MAQMNDTPSGARVGTHSAKVCFRGEQTAAQGREPRYVLVGQQPMSGPRASVDTTDGRPATQLSACREFSLGNIDNHHRAFPFPMSEELGYITLRRCTDIRKIRQ
jgi:hypothetical protein